jgi:hypothetical protein
MVVDNGIEIPGIHFQDQNTEQKSNRVRKLIENKAFGRNI